MSKSHRRSRSVAVAADTSAHLRSIFYVVLLMTILGMAWAEFIATR